MTVSLALIYNGPECTLTLLFCGALAEWLTAMQGEVKSVPVIYQGEGNYFHPDFKDGDTDLLLAWLLTDHKKRKDLAGKYVALAKVARFGKFSKT